MKKKILVSMLSFVLLVTFAPLSVFAGTNEIVVPDVKDFKAYAPDKYSVQVEWSKADDVRVEYWLYRGNAPSGDWGSPIAQLAHDNNSYKDTNVVAGNTYYYLMRQVIMIDGGAFFGNYSNMDYGRPNTSIIRGFSVWALDCTQAKMTWDKSPDEGVSYWIYRGTKPYGDWGPAVAKLDYNTTSWLDTSVKPTSKYYYLIRGVEDTGSGLLFGNYSNMDYASPAPPPIVDFEAWAPNSYSTKVSWNPYANHDISYWLSRTEDPDQEDPDWGYPDLNPVAMLDWDMTPRTDLDVVTGHKYYYKLQTFQCVDGKFYWGPYSKVDYAYPR